MLTVETVVNNYLKPLYKAHTDEELMLNSSNVHLFLVFVICGLLAIVPAPYGRYSHKWKTFLPTVNIPWTVILLPSVFVPVWVVLTDPESWNMELPNWIILIFFVTHYFHR